MGLAGIGPQVVELPWVRQDIAIRTEAPEFPLHVTWRGIREPAIIVNAAVAHHLVILNLMSGRGGRIIKGIGEADSVERHLGNAVEGARRFDVRDLELRRHDIDQMAILHPYPTSARQVPRPGDHEPIADPTEVRSNRLEPGIRRVHGQSPAGRIRILGFRTAHDVEMLSQPVVDVYIASLDMIEVEQLIDIAFGSAFTRAAIIALDEDDNRIVRQPHTFDFVENAPDLRIVVGQLSRIDLHVSLIDGLFFRAEAIPGGNLAWP